MNSTVSSWYSVQRERATLPSHIPGKIFAANALVTITSLPQFVHAGYQYPPTTDKYPNAGECRIYMSFLQGFDTVRVTRTVQHYRRCFAAPCRVATQCDTGRTHGNSTASSKNQARICEQRTQENHTLPDRQSQHEHKNRTAYPAATMVKFNETKLSHSLYMLSSQIQKYPLKVWCTDDYVALTALFLDALSVDDVTYHRCVV